MHKVICGILLLVSMPIAGFSQKSASWSNLTRLKTSNTVRVTKVDGSAIQGKFLRVSTDEIVIDRDKLPVSVKRPEVRRVDVQRRRLLSGLIGAGIGVAVGFAVLGAANSEEDFYGFAVPFFPVATGAGTAIGAAVPGHSTVYRAP